MWGQLATGVCAHAKRTNGIVDRTEALKNIRNSLLLSMGELVSATKPPHYARLLLRKSYGSRSRREDPRGREFSGSSGADSPIWPARVEGGKTVPAQRHQEPIRSDTAGLKGSASGNETPRDSRLVSCIPSLAISSATEKSPGQTSVWSAAIGTSPQCSRPFCGTFPQAGGRKRRASPDRRR